MGQVTYFIEDNTIKCEGCQELITTGDSKGGPVVFECHGVGIDLPVHQHVFHMSCVTEPFASVLEQTRNEAISKARLN